MSHHVTNTILICAIIGFIAWYYFQRLQDSEREYHRLHSRFIEVCQDNTNLKTRITDLQSYKEDVSKTFQILDNELVMINDHIKHKAQTNPQENRVSMLTPDILNSLFDVPRVPLEEVQEQSEQVQELSEQKQPEVEEQTEQVQQQEQVVSFMDVSMPSQYESYLISDERVPTSV